VSSIDNFHNNDVTAAAVVTAGLEAAATLHRNKSLSDLRWCDLPNMLIAGISVAVAVENGTNIAVQNDLG
jgi:hypothetical protein